VVATNTYRADFPQFNRDLRLLRYYRGRPKGDKCIAVNTNFKADVVLAVRINDYRFDPLAITPVSREVENYPAIHIPQDVGGRNDTYKATQSHVLKMGQELVGDRRSAA